MKIKHLVVVFGFLAGVLVLGCGGGNSGIVDANATQLYTTAGYTVDSSAVLAASKSSAN
jgi:hypothetical protein